MFQATAYRSSPPFLAAELDKLIAKLFFGVLSYIVVDAWELFAKETLLAAMAAERATSSFVFRSIWLSEAQPNQEAGGSSELGEDALMHLEMTGPRAAVTERKMGSVGLVGRDRVSMWISLDRLDDATRVRRQGIRCCRSNRRHAVEEVGSERRGRSKQAPKTRAERRETKLNDGNKRKVW